MLARLQSFITLSLVSAVVFWAIAAYQKSQPCWAWVGAASILGGYVFFMTLEFSMMHFQNRHDCAPRASLRQIMKAFSSEILTAPWVFCWLQPFRSQAVPDQETKNNSSPLRQSNTGVIFVHGFICNRGIWNPWLSQLKKNGIPFIAVNLEPIFSSIDDYTACIESAVNRLSERTGTPPILVAHSMGGLAIRAWLKAYQSEKRIKHVITIGSPHQGTWLGKFGLGINAQQMRSGSSWLQALSEKESPQGNSKFTCFFSHCDNIVFPASSGCLPGAKNIHLNGVAHLQMAHHDVVLQEIFQHLGVR